MLTGYGEGLYGGASIDPWLPLAVVRQHLGVEASTPQDLDADRARLAAGAYVEQARRDLIVTLPDDSLAFAATEDVIYGALLLTARLYSRRSTPQGLASFGEFGPGAIMRHDPDIERLLGLGRYGNPMVG